MKVNIYIGTTRLFTKGGGGNSTFGIKCDEKNNALYKLSM